MNLTAYINSAKFTLNVGSAKRIVAQCFSDSMEVNGYVNIGMENIEAGDLDYRGLKNRIYAPATNAGLKKCLELGVIFRHSEWADGGLVIGATGTIPKVWTEKYENRDDLIWYDFGGPCFQDWSKATWQDALTFFGRDALPVTI